MKKKKNLALYTALPGRMVSGHMRSVRPVYVDVCGFHMAQLNYYTLIRVEGSHESVGPGYTKARSGGPTALVRDERERHLPRSKQTDDRGSEAR